MRASREAAPPADALHESSGDQRDTLFPSTPKFFTISS
jgi:hypothetical protein